MADDAGLALQGGGLPERHLPTGDRIDPLEAVDVHPTRAEGGESLGGLAGLLEVRGDDKEVHVGLIDAVTGLGVVEAAVHEKE